MGSLQTEIGVMIAILVGAWAAKVTAVSVYVFCHRRRLQRQAASGASLPSACQCHKPTPQGVITSLPVISHAAAMQQLKAGSSGSSGAKQGAGKHAAAAAAVADAAGDVSQHQDQEQQPHTQAQLEQQPESSHAAPPAATAHQAADLRESGTVSQPGAAAGGAAAAAAAAGKPPALGQAITGSTEAECCPICFGEYDSAAVQVRQLPCRHYYHPECIDAWLVRDNTCPLCKALVWVPDSTPPPAAAAAAVAADDDATRQGLEQQHGHGQRHMMHVIVIGGPVPYHQRA